MRALYLKFCSNAVFVDDVLGVVRNKFLKMTSWKNVIGMGVDGFRVKNVLILAL